MLGHWRRGRKVVYNRLKCFQGHKRQDIIRTRARFTSASHLQLLYKLLQLLSCTDTLWRWQNNNTEARWSETRRIAYCTFSSAAQYRFTVSVLTFCYKSFSALVHTHLLPSSCSFWQTFTFYKNTVILFNYTSWSEVINCYNYTQNMQVSSKYIYCFMLL